MDWIQVFSICAYATVFCAFFYYFNEKTIRERRAEHEKQMEKASKEAREDRKESERHWREMFMHFNSRLDTTKNG